MPFTNEDAAQLLREASIAVHAADDKTLAVPRIQICRALMTLCHNGDARLPTPGWNTPLKDLSLRRPVNVDEDVETAAELFNILYERDQPITTFGDLEQYVEAGIRARWHPAVSGCASQSLFYELRRVFAVGSGDADKQAWARPGTQLRTCLPASEAEALSEVLKRRFGIDRLPVSRRVFGKMEFGATWLAVWFVAVVWGCLVFARVGLHPGWFLVYFVTTAASVAWLLSLVSRPVWVRVSTLGDLTRWVLKESSRATQELRATVEML